MRIFKLMTNAVLALILALGILQAEDKPAKAVYDLTTRDTQVFKTRFFGGIVSTSEHYAADLRDFKAAVMIHGGAYRFFLKDPSKSKWKKDRELAASREDISKILTTLKETYGVEFMVCGAGLKKHGIDKKDVQDFVKIIPNAVIGLVDKQGEGYAYIPVGD